MIRIVAENLLLFLLPSLAYIGYRMLVSRAGSPAGALDDAPVLWLFVAGAMMVVVSLVFFASSSGGRPGEAYAPPVLREGHIVPGHRIQSPSGTAQPAPANPVAKPSGPAGRDG